MNDRSNRALEHVAEETLRVVAQGGYEMNGVRVELTSLAAAMAGMRTVGPDALDGDLTKAPAAPSGTPNPETRARLELTSEKTQEAAHRLVVDEGVTHLVLLNFASATTAGGGFLHGARAQEEDLCRCSALHPCLATQTEFYAYHRAANTALYSDRLIYSPRVPFFRVTSALLSRPYEASVITAAAPNAGAIRAHEPQRASQIESTFRRRAAKVLALAEAEGHRTLLLGAWGCGVFANDPSMAADALVGALESPRFRAAFDRVVFAVYDPSGLNHAAFAARLRS